MKNTWFKFLFFIVTIEFKKKKKNCSPLPLGTVLFDEIGKEFTSYNLLSLFYLIRTKK